MQEIDCPVLIAGGSLTGLSTALFLASHGVRPLVVERHAGTAIHPRAGVFHQRTQEIWRSVGLEDEVVRRASEEFTQDGAIVAVESLAGRELASFLPSLNEGVRDVSPSLRLYCTQNVLEPILRRRAEELGARILFGTEMVSFEPGPDGVTAVIRNRSSGDEQRVSARYLVAADGNRSPVRERLGIAMKGRGTFSHSATVYFRADVRPVLRNRALSVVYVKNRTLTGFMRFESNGQSGFLAVNALFGPEGKVPDVAAVADEARCVEMVRDAIGVPDLDVEIVVVQPWKAAADCAERFSVGRVLLAGDAVHTMPPTGGFGGNTGVGDAHNLAWKLALVLQGKAGEALLDTYDTERRPVGAFTAEQAYTRYVKRTDPSLGDEDVMPQEDDLRIELGHCYASPAVCLEEGQDFVVHRDPRTSRALPGSRAPHLLLVRDGKTCSTLDLFGREFVVLAGARGDPWRKAAASASAALGVPVAAHCIGPGHELVPREGNFETAFGLDAPEGAVLVRPDGFVAWRQRGPAGTPDAELTAAMTRILCRNGS